MYEVQVYQGVEKESWFWRIRKKVRKDYEVVRMKEWLKGPNC